MKVKHCLTIGLLLAAISSYGQSGVFDLSFEGQIYPTGLIPGVRLERGIGKKSALHLRLGYQIIDHRDQGKHADETGTGYGFTLGYKRYFNHKSRALHVGLRNDVWFNKIDWKNGLLHGEVGGTAKITVLQPTAEAGWTFLLGEKTVLAPTLALGYEINVKTKGEPTGEGAIVLVGIQLGHRFEGLKD
ncbi:MAG: hypothetical protein HY842_14375 [Bacteroidetes bacterium]|nr:hypothetical protein [Bacteroidota bacterium]